MTAAYTFPPAYPHGTLTEVFPDLFVVTGSMRFPAPIGMYCSRNMTVVRNGGSLVLVNTVRLDEAGLAALDRLGRVEHVIRLAGFHGSDDPFYKDRYGATVWAVKNQPYARGFQVEPPPEACYFRPDHEIDEDTALPVAARLYRFPSCKLGEGLLLLERDGGVVISGDVLQHWTGPDPYFNLLGRLAFRALGFFRPHNIGPGWLGYAHPHPAELRGILDLSFEHVLPAHGAPVIGGAREKYRPAIEAAAEKAEKARR